MAYMKNGLLITAVFIIIILAACGRYTAAVPAVLQEAHPVSDTPAIVSGQLWYDDKGGLINAHGGGIIYSNNTYYWFGEKRGRSASEGVQVYASPDLYHWKNEGLAFSPDYTDSTSEIAFGCVMERPKVIYNAKTAKYVLWFHLELKEKGYSAARAGVAVSDKITGPYKYVHSFRPNGNMSRDMTLFAAADGNAYHIYSSRENYDLRITKLADDFLTPTAEDKMLFSNHREAPALFAYNGKYYMITSGCTGWQPNKAAVHEAASVWGPWKELPYNPMEGAGADITFGGQSTFVLPVAGKKDAFIFMADKWNPRNLQDSRYIWLPVQFSNQRPVIKWMNAWDLSFFNTTVKQ
jgi:Glycosyl hydrolases family 43